MIKSKIRAVPNWPKKGIVFRDITPLLEDKKAFRLAIDKLAKPYLKTKIDKIVGIDARGFILASALAYKLKTGLAIIRKRGKLPPKTISEKYALEYGSNTIEIRNNSVKARERVLLVDDVLATGGTVKAAAKLVEKLKGKIIGISFLIELPELNGRKKLKNYSVKSLVNF